MGRGLARYKWPHDTEKICSTWRAEVLDQILAGIPRHRSNRKTHQANRVYDTGAVHFLYESSPRITPFSSKFAPT